METPALLVCTVVKVCLEIYHEFDSPASLYLSTGNYALWLRYGEWLLTCPVSPPQLAMRACMLHAGNHRS